MSCLLPYISNSPYSQTTKDKMQSLHTDIFVKLKETKGIYQHKSGFLYLPVGTTERTQLERKQVTTSLGLINKDRKLVSIVKREVGNKIFEVLKVDVSGVGIEYDAQERQQYETDNNLTSRVLYSNNTTEKLSSDSVDFVQFLRGKLDGSKLSEEIDGKLEANKDRLIELLGSSMYSEKLKDVVYKELLQNSFDAVKIAESKGIIDKGKIDIEVNEKERIISFSDNGIGMTPEIVQKAFFTIGGTYKGDDVDNKLKSGGLGLAKMAFIFGSEKLELETVKDGIKTTVSATSEDIRKDNFKIKTEATNEKNGTRVSVKIPQNYIDSKGETRNIDFPRYPESEFKFSFLSNPLIGNVEVNYSMVNRDSSYAKNENIKTNLGHIPKGFVLFSPAKTSFADMDIYIDTNNITKGSFSDTEHKILSSGLFQFDFKFTTKENEKIPLNIIIDIKPKIDATNAQYPFNNQRENFKPTIKEDINALNKYLSLLWDSIEIEMLKSSFSKIKNIEAVNVESVDNSVINKNKEITESFTSLSNSEIIKKAVEDFSKSNEEVVIEDGGLKTKELVIPKEEIDREKEKVYGRTFNADKQISINKEVGLNLDSNKPIIHNNTNMNIDEKATKFLSEISSIMIEYKNSIIDFYGEDYSSNIKTQLWGVSIDKSYGGVNVNPSFLNMLAINPFYQFPDNPKVDAVNYIAVALDHLIIHELNHNFERNEGAGFTGRFLTTYSEIHSLPNYFELISKLKLSVKNNLETIKKLNHEYQQSENVETGFEGNRFETNNQERANSGINSISQDDSTGDVRAKKNDTRSDNELGEILGSNRPDSLYREDRDLENKYFSDGSTQKVSTILDKISKSDHPLNKLAEHLKSYAKINDVDVELVYSNFVGEITSPAQFVFYSDGTGYIQIASDALFINGNSESVLLHEILHAFSYKELRTNNKFNETFNKLYEQSKAKLGEWESGIELYGNKDIDEFFVALFTDAKFIKQLQEIPAIDIKNHKNLFEEIMDYILGLLKINKGDSVYTQAFAVATNILQQALINKEEQENFDNFYSERMYQLQSDTTAPQFNTTNSLHEVAKAFSKRFNIDVEVITPEQARTLLDSGVSRDVFFQILDEVDVFNSKDVSTAKSFIDKVFRTVENKEEAQKAYKKLAIKYHPDRSGSNEIMSHINVVYDNYKAGTLSKGSQTSNKSNQGYSGFNDSFYAYEEYMHFKTKQNEYESRETKYNETTDKLDTQIKEAYQKYQLDKKEASSRKEQQLKDNEARYATNSKKIKETKETTLKNIEETFRNTPKSNESFKVKYEETNKANLKYGNDIRENSFDYLNSAQEINKEYFSRVSKLDSDYLRTKQNLEDLKYKARNTRFNYQKSTSSIPAGFYDTVLKKAFLVEGLADDTTPIHEIFTHPFLEIIENNNNQLYKNLLKEAKSDNKITSYVDSTYKEQDQSVKDKEYIARAIDLDAKKQLSNKSLIDFIKEFWDEFKGYVSNIFGGKQSNVLNINPNTTIAELVDFVLNSGQALDLNNTVVPQFNETTKQQLLDFLKQVNPNFKVETLDNLGFNGLLDLKNALIQLQTGQESALSEEVSHVFVEMLDPKLKSSLQKLIKGSKIYSETYEAYKDVYKKNGKPDLDKIEREAVAKLLAQAVYAQSTGDYSRFNEWSSTQLTGLKLWINDFINWILGLDMNSFLKFADQLLKGDTSSLTSTEIDEVDNIWYQMTSDQVNQASGHLLNYDNLTQRIDEAAEFINNTLDDLLKNKSLTDLNKIFQTEEGKFLPKKLIQTTKNFSHDLNMQVQSAKNFIVTIDQMKSFFETIENEVLSDIENRPSDKVKLDEAATVYSIIKQWKAYVSELHMDLASEKGDLKDLIDGLNTSLHSSEARLLNIFQDEVFHYFSEDIDKANKETERIYNEKLEAIDKSGLPKVTKDKLSEETKLERDKFLWDKRKLTHLLLGHKDDVSSLSLMLVNASNTDDPIIALFRKNLDRLMFKNRDENITRIEKFRSEVKLPDMSREELGSKFTKEETEYVYDYEKGIWEEKTNRFFLNEVNNKAYVDAKKLKEDYDSAKRAYHEKTIPYKEFLAKKKAYMTFMFKNWNQPLVKEFYEKNFLYNPDLVSPDKQEALEYLQNKIEDIWERMDLLDLEIEKQGGIPTKDQEKSRKDILIEYKFLSNPRDVTGLEKVGIDKEAYEIMKDKMSWKKEQDFYDYELNQDQFTREFKYHASLLDKTSFEEDIFNQIDTHINAGEYDKVRSILDAELSISDASIILPALTAINKWFTDHTAIKLDPAFYEERKLITERLEQVEDEISKIIGTEKVSYKDTWDRVFELTSPYRDRNGVINATLIPDEVKQILYDLEDELSKKRRETSNDRSAYLKNNFFEQSELDKLYGNKKAGIEGLFNEQKKLLAQIDEYQTRDYNEYWEDVSSNLPIGDVSAFKNATSIFYGEDAKPRYIWSKQIIKKTQYEKLLPTSEFYKRKIKDEYKTQKITFKQSDELASQGIFQQNGKPIIPTVNEFGDWIPITMTNQGKVVGNPEYINNEFFTLKTDKELFSIMERLKQEYIDAQLKLDRRERQNFRVPQKLRDLFEDFSLKEKWDNFGQSFKQGGEGNMLTVLKDWSIFDEVGSMKVNVPVRYSERVEKPTKDVLESVFAYVEGVELAEKLKDQLPIVQAIDSVMSINPQSNKNRLEKFRGIVDRDFKGQKKAYELGPNKTWGKRIDYVVRSVMKLTAIRSLSIFNPFNNVKNFLAAKATTRINFNVSAKLIDPALTQADLWVGKHLTQLIMEGQSDHPSSFEYKLIEYFSPELSGKFKEYLPGQMKEVIKKGSFLMSGMEFGEYMNTCTTIVAYLKAIPYDGGTLFDALTLQGGKITSPINLEDHRLVIREFLRTWQGNVGSQREAVEADKYTLASMALFFKRYLIPTALNNFGSRRYNFVRNDVTQGYWRTVYTFMLRNVHTGFKHLKDNWNVLSNEEKINMFKAIRQAIILLTFTMVMMYILGFKGSDPDKFKKLKKNGHIHNQMIYLTLMIENETSALSPLRLGNVTNEVYRNVKSPFLMLKPYEDIVNVLDSGTDAIMGSPDARYKRATGKVKKGNLKVWNHLLTLTPLQKTRGVFDRDVLIEDIKITQQMMTRR